MIRKLPIDSIGRYERELYAFVDARHAELWNELRSKGNNGKEWDGLVARIASTLAPDGVVALCHWRHRVEGWVLDADDVHRRFADGSLPPLQATYRDRDVEIHVHAADWPDHER